MPVQVVYQADYDFDIMPSDPSLMSDEFTVYDTCDDTFAWVELEIDGDSSGAQEPPVIVGVDYGSMTWSYQLAIGEAGKTSGVTVIHAYKVYMDNNNYCQRKYIGEIALIKHNVKDGAETLQSVAGEEQVTLYRYVYGLEKLNTVITSIPSGVGGVAQGMDHADNAVHNYTNTCMALAPGAELYMAINAYMVKLWHHIDRLGTTHYLTDNVDGKVTSIISYDDWGVLTSKAVVRLGARELDLVQNYTGHPTDMVLGAYYAKARMYDAGDRRFTSSSRKILGWEWVLCL